MNEKQLFNHPKTAQASWRWTMGVIDNIENDPSLLDISELENGKDWDVLGKQLIVKDFMKLIKEAKFIFWDVNIFNAALRGADSFVGERFDTSEWRASTYYTYDRMQDSVSHKDQVSFGMLIMTVSLDIGIDTVVPIEFNGVITEQRDGVDIVDHFALEVIGQAKDGREIVKEDLISQQLTAANAFLRMKVAAKERARLPRPERRRMQKEGKEEPELYTVSLRRSQSKVETAGDGEAIERDCHWLVSGHWRRQWYPSVEKHAPLWIDGHVKGDTTKPFKPSKKRVFAAVR